MGMRWVIRMSEDELGGIITKTLHYFQLFIFTNQGNTATYAASSTSPVRLTTIEASALVHEKSSARIRLGTETITRSDGRRRG